MSFIIVGVAAASGLTKIGMALAGRKKRIAEQKAANNFSKEEMLTKV